MPECKACLATLTNHNKGGNKAEFDLTRLENVDLASQVLICCNLPKNVLKLFNKIFLVFHCPFLTFMTSNQHLMLFLYFSSIKCCVLMVLKLCITYHIFTFDRIPGCTGGQTFEKADCNTYIFHFVWCGYIETWEIHQFGNII